MDKYLKMHFGEKCDSENIGQNPPKLFHRFLLMFTMNLRWGVRRPFRGVAWGEPEFAGCIRCFLGGSANTFNPRVETNSGLSKTSALHRTTGSSPLIGGRDHVTMTYSHMM